MTNICLIIPVYNEASILNDVLAELIPLGYSIILVDDGSSDDSFRIASAFPITVIRHQINLGQGAALETGMEAARRLSAEFVIHFDADGQHDTADIENLLKPLQNGKTDFVFGSRFLGKKASGLPWSRKIILNTGRWINYILTGILLTDAHNGFRAFNKKALNSIHLEQRGMAHATEIMEAVRKNSLSYMEIPVHIRYSPYSKQKGQNLFDTVHILFNLLFKRN
jgi:glycosyltransferase involved in cell wall biosynthesis